MWGIDGEGTVMGRGAKVALAGLAGVRGESACEVRRRRAGRGRFDGCLLDPLGRPQGGSDVGSGPNGATGRASRRTRNRSRGRCRASVKADIWDRVARLTRPVYTIWARMGSGAWVAGEGSS